MKIARSKVKVKCHQLPTTSSVHHGTYSCQVTSISDQQFFLDFVRTDRQTTSKTMHAANNKNSSWPHMTTKQWQNSAPDNDEQVWTAHYSRSYITVTSQDIPRTLRAARSRCTICFDSKCAIPWHSPTETLFAATKTDNSVLWNES